MLVVFLVFKSDNLKSDPPVDWVGMSLAMGDILPNNRLACQLTYRIKERFIIVYCIKYGTDLCTCTINRTTKFKLFIHVHVLL